MRVVAPAALFLTGLQAMRRSARIAARNGAIAQKSLNPLLIVGALYVLAALAEPGGDNFERAAGRSVALFALYFVALLYGKSPEDRARIRSAVVVGATIGAAIAIASALFSLQPFGSPLLPNRSFVLPVNLPKTTGLPRSFGEAGVIYAGGLVLSRSWSRGFSRIVTTTTLLGGFAIGQSRNMLVVLATAVALAIIAPRIRRIGRLASAIGLVALFSPVVASALVNQSLVREQFVGDGIFETNVESRLSLADELSQLASRGDLFKGPFGATRENWFEFATAAPHNHFVSLIALDGLVGVLFIIFAFLIPIVRSGRSSQLIRGPEFRWFVSTVVALSFYEAAFSASATVSLALVHGITLARQPTSSETTLPDSAEKRTASNQRQASALRATGMLPDFGAS